MSEPSIGPSSDRALKSTARKRGSFPSAWKPPPPTVDGRLFTSPANRWSPSPSSRRYVRGSRNGSGPRKWREKNLISSFDTWPSGANGASSERRWFRPFSSMMTDHPAAVSTSAAVAPAGPVPTITASHSGTGDLLVGVPPRLDVAGEADGTPHRAAGVAPVLRCAVEALARVLVEQVAEGRVGREAAVLLLAVGGGEVVAERGEPAAVALLQPDDRAVELAGRDPLRALDARAP